MKKGAGNWKIGPALFFIIPAQGKCKVLSLSAGSPETQRRTSGTSLRQRLFKALVTEDGFLSEILFGYLYVLS